MYSIYRYSLFTGGPNFGIQEYTFYSIHHTPWLGLLISESVHPSPSASICCRDPNRIDVYQWSRSREGERDDISGWISLVHFAFVEASGSYRPTRGIITYNANDLVMILLSPLRKLTGRSNPNYIPSECVVLRSMYGYHCVAN